MDKKFLQILTLATLTMTLTGGGVSSRPPTHDECLQQCKEETLSCYGALPKDEQSPGEGEPPSAAYMACYQQGQSCDNSCPK